MKAVGFFRELSSDNSLAYEPTLSDIAATGDTCYPQDLVVRYLLAGHPVLDVMEGTGDVIGGTFRVPGGSSVLTDGTYFWRLDLASYVQHHTIPLPRDFTDAMAENGFEVPSVPRERLIAVSLEVNDLLGFR
jgi:hypothetical protein